MLVFKAVSFFENLSTGPWENQKGHSKLEQSLFFQLIYPQ